MFLARTRLYGREADIKLDTIEEVVSWAEFHNLQFTQTTARPRHEEFECHNHDATPLGADAVRRLLRCLHLATPAVGIQTPGPTGTGIDSSANGEILRGIAALKPPANS